MSKIYYRHFQLKKRNGRVSKSQLIKTKKRILEWVNSYSPRRKDIQAVISEGANSRDFHLWVRKNNRSKDWNLLWHRFEPDVITNVLGTERYLLLGIDGASTQSVYYLCEHHD